jgi:hypothetical protein
MEMDSKQTLKLWDSLSKCIGAELKTNEAFAEKIGALFAGLTPPAAAKKSTRRPPAKIDPFALMEQSDAALLTALSELSIDELKDVIAANGMDPARAAMRWRKAERLIDHIVEMTKIRSAHGQVFWEKDGEKA